MAITGMTCEHCARTIRNHLLKAPGVKQVEIDWQTGFAEVAFDPGVTAPAAILENLVFRQHYSARVVPDR